MKRNYIKYLLSALLPFLCLLMLSGCHAEHEINIAVTGKTADDCQIDILLPLEEELSEYISYAAKRAFPNGKDGKFPLAEYCEDGYRSALIHYRGNLDSRCHETENGFTQIIAFNSWKEYRALCQKYRTFRLAEYDKNGNVLYVSEPYELIESGSDDRIYTTGKWEYDAAAHELKMDRHYDRPIELIMIEALAEILIDKSPIPYAVFFVTLLIFFFSKRNDVPKRKTLLNVVLVSSGAMLCVMLMIPVPVYLLCRLDCAVKTKVPLSTVWTDFLSQNIWTKTPDTLDHILFVCYCFIPLAAVIGLCICMIVQRHRKKQPEET